MLIKTEDIEKIYAGCGRYYDWTDYRAEYIINPGYRTSVFERRGAIGIGVLEGSHLACKHISVS